MTFYNNNTFTPLPTVEIGITHKFKAVQTSLGKELPQTPGKTLEQKHRGSLPFRPG